MRHVVSFFRLRLLFVPEKFLFLPFKSYRLAPNRRGSVTVDDEGEVAVDFTLGESLIVEKTAPCLRDLQKFRRSGCNCSLGNRKMPRPPSTGLGPVVIPPEMLDTRRRVEFEVQNDLLEPEVLTKTLEHLEVRTPDVNSLSPVVVSSFVAAAAGTHAYASHHHITPRADARSSLARCGGESDRRAVRRARQASPMVVAQRCGG